MRTRLAVLACTMLLSGCGQSHDAPPVAPPSSASPYLLVVAGDEDGADSDFLAVLDVRPGSADRGKAIATTPIGMTKSMPHHMEYSLPPGGELLFMNAHHHEKSLLVDVSDARHPRIAKAFDPPAPLRFPHDYYRTPKGTRLVGFLRDNEIDVAERATLDCPTGGASHRFDIVDALQQFVDRIDESERPILIPDTAINTLDLGDRLEAVARRPVLTANQATLWHVARRLGVPLRIARAGSLLQRGMLG